MPSEGRSRHARGQDVGADLSDAHGKCPGHAHRVVKTFATWPPEADAASGTLCPGVVLETCFPMPKRLMRHFACATAPLSLGTWARCMKRPGCTCDTFFASSGLPLGARSHCLVSPIPAKTLASPCLWILLAIMLHSPVGWTAEHPLSCWPIFAYAWPAHHAP